MRHIKTFPDAPELAFNSEIAATVNEIGDAAPSTATTSTMSVGDDFYGSLSSTADVDWVRVSLVAGETYSFKVSGFGGDPLFDPRFEIRDAAGNVVIGIDSGDAIDDTYSISFTPTTSGDFYVDIDLFGGGSAGDYHLTVDVASPTDALEWGGAAWDNSQTITVYFALTGTTVDDEGNLIVSDGFTQAEIDLIMGIFSGVTEFANINFAQTGNKYAADIQLATDNLGASLMGYMYPQGSSISSDGLGVFNSNSTFWNAASMAVGGFMYSVVVHELGHGLGLAHPHDNGGGSDILPGVTSSSDTGDNGEMNQSIYTIMSYNDSWNGHPLGLPATYAEGYMSSFAALDMAVLQSYYGANMSHNTGANTYSMGSNAYYM
ncbi:MAG: hypothetical protein GY947_13425, partial [Rhodobacteraceae bacterium]|nr:hypothetical protein [Paracoccaceae bacterium]